jgi:tagatose-1,6-bisphosphate aldolase
VKQHGNRAVKITLWWYMNEEEERKITNLERINTLVIHIWQNGMT